MDSAPLWSLQPFVRYVRRLNIQVGEYPRLLVPCDCRLFYVTETGGWMNFPGQSLALRQGMLLLWRCGYPYGMESRPGSLCRFLAVNFDLTLSHAEESFPIPPVEQEQFCSEQLLCSPLCPELPLDQPLILDNALFVQPLLEQLLEDYEGARPYRAQLLTARMQEILILTARRLCWKQEDQLVGRVLDFIRLHCGEPLTNRQLGEQFGFHPNALNRLVAGRTGCSLHQQLLNCRLREAIRLIESTDWPIGRIAGEVGFSDPGYFARLFRKKIGRSPSEYRK